LGGLASGGGCRLGKIREEREAAKSVLPHYQECRDADKSFAIEGRGFWMVEMLTLISLAGSGIKLITALFVLAWGLRGGWKLVENQISTAKVPVMMAVLLATFPPVGLVLYYKFWEEKPPLSSVCLVQAVLGVVAIIIFHLVNRFSPVMPPW